MTFLSSADINDPKLDYTSIDCALNRGRNDIACMLGCIELLIWSPYRSLLLFLPLVKDLLSVLCWLKQGCAHLFWFSLEIFIPAIVTVCSEGTDERWKSLSSTRLSNPPHRIYISLFRIPCQRWRGGDFRGHSPICHWLSTDKTLTDSHIVPCWS